MTQMTARENTSGAFEQWLTVPEAAKLLKIPRTRCYDLISQGDLPAVRIGARTIRVPRSELRRFLLKERPVSRANVTERE